jgi:hypothetical protein
LSSFPTIPPDTRAPGQSGHIEDHNAISDSLNALQAAIVALQLTNGAAVLTASSQPGSYTLAATDLGTVVEISASGASTVTIPPSASVPFPVGALVRIFQAGTGSVTVAPAAGVTLNSYVSTTLLGQYAQVTLRQRSLNLWSLT